MAAVHEQVDVPYILPSHVLKLSLDVADSTGKKVFSGYWFLQSRRPLDKIK